MGPGVGEDTHHLMEYHWSLVRSLLKFEIVSKECRQCMNSSGKENTRGFEEWWGSHQHQCHANFGGSSNAMGAVGCVNIFSR